MITSARCVALIENICWSLLKPLLNFQQTQNNGPLSSPWIWAARSHDQTACT